MKIQKNNTEGGWFTPLLWFVGILAIFWILWYYSGGPNQPDVNQGPFMRPSAPINDGQGYGQFGR